MIAFYPVVSSLTVRAGVPRPDYYGLQEGGWMHSPLALKKKKKVEIQQRKGVRLGLSAGSINLSLFNLR